MKIIIAISIFSLTLVSLIIGLRFTNLYRYDLILKSIEITAKHCSGYGGSEYNIENGYFDCKH
jgi:hypothetical protein